MGDYYRGGRIAQLEEHRPYKPGVTGSNPVPPTRSCIKERNVGVVVQLVRTPACHAGGREFESRRPRHLTALSAVQEVYGIWSERR